MWFTRGGYVVFRRGRRSLLPHFLWSRDLKVFFAYAPTIVADLVSNAFIALDIPDGNGRREVNNDIDGVSGRGGEPWTRS
jgi:hypothetical protein